MTLTTPTTDTAAEAQPSSPTASLPVTVEHQTPPRAGRAARRTLPNGYKRAVVAEYEAAPVGTKVLYCAESGFMIPMSMSGVPRSKRAHWEP